MVIPKKVLVHLTSSKPVLLLLWHIHGLRTQALRAWHSSWVGVCRVGFNRPQKTGVGEG